MKIVGIKIEVLSQLTANQNAYEAVSLLETIIEECNVPFDVKDLMLLDNMEDRRKVMTMVDSFFTLKDMDFFLEVDGKYELNKEMFVYSANRVRK